MIETLGALIGSSLDTGTILALAALGLLINEKAGVVNLGAEGVMLCSALAGFVTVVYTQSFTLGLLSGMGVGVLLTGLYGMMVIGLGTNQYATGLALSLFGAGFSAFMGVSYVQEKLPELPHFNLPVLADLPGFGSAFFQHHPLVYGALLLALGLNWGFDRSRLGLIVKSVGENPQSAHALGYSVQRIRLGAVMVGGGLCGLAGAYLSTYYAPLWVEGMTSGKGWIALALTTFATWRPLRVLLGAYLFGFVSMLQMHLQSMGVEISVQFMTMLPYLATILVLVLISRNPEWIRLHMPSSLGKPFRAG